MTLALLTRNDQPPGLARRTLMSSALVGWLAGCTTTSARSRPDVAGQEQQVRATELAFAQTMARRDHAAFVSFLADDAIFVNGTRPLRGKTAVAEHWKRFYASPQPPFAWEPDLVQVPDSGGLALSSGPVTDPGGKLIARFQSTWRLEESGLWRIVFDSGCAACACDK